MMLSGELYAPAASPQEKNPITHWVWGWVDPRASLDVLEKRTSLLHHFRIQSRDWPANSSFGVPSMLSWLLLKQNLTQVCCSVKLTLQKITILPCTTVNIEKEVQSVVAAKCSILTQKIATQWCLVAGSCSACHCCSWWWDWGL